jgi:putative sigma-54 modulation protein
MEGTSTIMNIHITFKNMNPSNSLRSFIEEQSQGLSKYFNGKITLTWVLSHEKLDHIAHCHLIGDHMDYYGESSTQDFKASIDLVFDRLEKQIKKHKEIVKNHHHTTTQKDPISES